MCAKSNLNTIFHPNNIRGVSHWGHVSSLEKGKIYAGGTIGSFQALTGWKVFVSINIYAKTSQGGRVIYFGDHLAADLADVTLHHGWKTAAVIR